MSVTPMDHAKKSLLSLAVLLALAPGLLATGPADLRKLYSPIIKRIAETHRIDQELVHVVIRAESNYDAFAISSAGAMGLMQLMPDTARQYGVGNVFDPAQNIEGGVRYLKDLVRLYGGRTKLVLAAYNAGQSAVSKYKGIPPYPETRNYIAGIMRSYKKPTVSTKNPTYMIKDASGRTVLVNDPPPAAVKK
ncbi:MAG: lytic transglycosylase domain-containing protein [Candidatus Aminicenantes bacterium]|nr:lytic transglycosylase domain-containing protein [Candidatus Aminicenantes bacterium]